MLVKYLITQPFSGSLCFKWYGKDDLKIVHSLHVALCHLAPHCHLARWGSRRDVYGEDHEDGCNVFHPGPCKLPHLGAAFGLPLPGETLVSSVRYFALSISPISLRMTVSASSAFFVSCLRSLFSSRVRIRRFRAFSSACMWASMSSRKSVNALCTTV